MEHKCFGHASLTYLKFKEHEKKQVEEGKHNPVKYCIWWAFCSSRQN